MSTGETPGQAEALEQATPLFKVRLPGFVQDDQIGLGDVITRFTNSVGIEPCSGCAGRARTLNSWIAFTR